MSPEEALPRLTPEALYQLVLDHREDAKADHKRLREDHESVAERVYLLEAERARIDAHFERIDQQLRQPTEVSALRFTPQMVVAIALVCVSIAGGWAATYALATQVSSQMQEFRRMQQLQQYDIQSLRETIIKQGARP